MMTLNVLSGSGDFHRWMGLVPFSVLLAIPIVVVALIVTHFCSPKSGFSGGGNGEISLARSPSKRGMESPRLVPAPEGRENPIGARKRERPGQDLTREKEMRKDEAEELLSWFDKNDDIFEFERGKS
jgi:hypothetical protein